MLRKLSRRLTYANVFGVPLKLHQERNLTSVRKLVILASLLVAFCVVAPAVAGAKRGGTDRPVKGTASGNVTVTLGAPLRLKIDLTGVATHFGKYRAHLEADGRIIGGEVVGGGTMTVAAANGDHVTGTFTVTGPLPSGAVHATTAVMTITGGTGRFADASGTMTSQNLVTPYCLAGPSCPGLLLETLKGRLSGQISY